MAISNKNQTNKNEQIRMMCCHNLFYWTLP